MEMMGPNGMMMRQGMGPGPPGMPGMGPGMGPRPGQGHPGMMQGPGNGMMGHGPMGQMMGPGHPGMQHGPMGSRPPPPEYGMSQQGGQNMPYMMGPGSNMRLPGPQRNAGMQQIPPSGPMMRAQNSLGDKIRMPQQMGMAGPGPGPGMNPMMMGGMNPGMKQG